MMARTGNTAPLRAGRLAGLAATIASALGTAVFAASAAAESADAAAPVYSAGHKALFMCSAHYLAGRSAEDIKKWELAYAADMFNAPGDAWLEPQTRSAVGTAENGTVQRRAVFREGMGCVLLGERVSIDSAAGFPRRTLPVVDAAARAAAWPDGDRIPTLSAEQQRIARRLQPILDAAFDGKTYFSAGNIPKDDTATLGVVILYRGQLIAERYRDGWGPHVQYRTYSAAKSFTNLMAGIRVHQGRLDIDRPVLFPEWSPDDPRRALTTRHYLGMSSGQECDGGGGKSLDTYFDGGRDAAFEAASRKLEHAPGEYWCYSNYDSISVARAVRRTFERVEDALDFPYSAALLKIGMRDTTIETDSYGNFIMSSQIWTTPRDLARFGLLYARDGVWNGERLLPEGWVKYTTTPVSAPKAAPGRNPRAYGAQFWLYNDHPRLPRDTFSAVGHQGQYSTIVPSRDVVIARMGLHDWQHKEFVADVLEAIEDAR
jgi:CubicO group peptidase (beta-lactamase class C family)